MRAESSDDGITVRGGRARLDSGTTCVRRRRVTDDQVVASPRGVRSAGWSRPRIAQDDRLAAGYVTEHIRAGVEHVDRGLAAQHDLSGNVATGVGGRQAGLVERPGGRSRRGSTEQRLAGIIRIGDGDQPLQETVNLAGKRFEFDRLGRLTGLQADLLRLGKDVLCLEDVCLCGVQTVPRLSDRRNLRLVALHGSRLLQHDFLTVRIIRRSMNPDARRNVALQLGRPGLLPGQVALQ